MARPLYIVDAFTDQPLGGNPAAVVLLEPEDPPMSEGYMQRLAREVNQPATAFVASERAVGPDRFRLRWFTPVAELDLCGHGTLASAQVLYDAGRLDLQTPILFETKSGLLKATPDPREGGFALDFPATPPQGLTSAPAGLLGALGIDGGQDGVRFIGRSVFDYFVEMADARQVRQLSPRFAELAKLEARGAIVSAVGDQGCDVVSRCFFPAQGIDEDSATGSAHCTIGPHFAAKLGRQRLLCHQASARGGLIRVRVEGQRVHLGGTARTVVRGELVE